MKLAENISVACFAFFGGAMRYVLSQNFCAAGTLIANLCGCFLLSFITFFVIKRAKWPSWLTNGLGTGMIGALTTFSTFSFETVAFLQQGAVLTGVTYWLANLCGGLLLAALGCALGGKL